MRPTWLLADPLEEQLPGWSVEGALVKTSWLDLWKDRVSSQLFKCELPGESNGQRDTTVPGVGECGGYLVSVTVIGVLSLHFRCHIWLSQEQMGRVKSLLRVIAVSLRWVEAPRAAEGEDGEEGSLSGGAAGGWNSLWQAVSRTVTCAFLNSW